MAEIKRLSGASIQVSQEIWLHVNSGKPKNTFGLFVIEKDQEHSKFHEVALPYNSLIAKLEFIAGYYSNMEKT